MDASESKSEIHQVIVKLLDGKHRILHFDSPSIFISALKSRIETITSIPSALQRLTSGSRNLYDDQTLIIGQSGRNPQFPADSSIGLDGFSKFPLTVNLLLRLRGGKGGFGSLLRGAATKAGQKKTNNFDACRDMSGRRLRHVNAEKKLEEWRAEAEERKLEKMAEDFLKKKAKENKRSGKGNGGDGAEKYVAKYREDSEKCMEEVERSVRASVKGLMSSKRKSQAEGNESASKKFKVWLGKRKLGESDSEEDEDGTGVEEQENEGSVIIDNRSNSDSSKEVDPNAGEEFGVGSVEQGSSENDLEESLKSVKDTKECEDNNCKDNVTPVMESLDGSKDQIGVDSPSKSDLSEVQVVVSQHPGTSGSEDEVVSAAETRKNPAPETVSATENIEIIEKPLNFDDYLSAAELEVLGLERIKSELQGRGLKCGGTLQERAARLFLLKSTPLEKLPKKLFAKK